MSKKSFKIKNSVSLEETSRQSDSVAGESYYDQSKGSFANKSAYWSFLESKTDVPYQADLTSTVLTTSITESAIIKITGSPASAFNLHGLVRNNNAKIIHIYNDTNQKMVIKHQSVTETIPSARITTPKTTDLSIAKKSLVIFYYDDTTSSWIANQASGGSGGTSFDQIQAGHGFTMFTPIYHDGSTWQKAQANASNTLATYVVTEYSTNAFTATKFGVIEAPAHGLTIGEFYYVSGATAGAITSTEPIFGYSNPVLYVQDATNVHIMAHRPSLIGDGNVSDSEISSIVAFPSYTEPVGFLYADGRAVSRTTYNELFNKIGIRYGRGDNSTTFNLPDLRGQFLRGGIEVVDKNFLSAAVEFSVNDYITIPGHGFKHTGFKVRFSTTGTLPSPLGAGTDYFVIYIDDNTIQLATSLANAKVATHINLTDGGIGVHTIYQWLDPDANSRYALQNGGYSGNLFGSIQDDELRSHNHTYTAPLNTGAAGSISLNNRMPVQSNTTGYTGGNETRPQNLTVGFFIRYAAKGAIKGQDPLMEIFATTISGATVAASGILFYRAPKAMTVTIATLSLFAKGSATGTLTIDIQKNSTPNPTGMTSILTTPLTMNVTAASDYAEQIGNPNSSISIVAGQWLRLDLTSVPTSMGDFYISVYGA